MIPTDFIGTLPGWVTAGGMMAMVGIVLRYRLGLRKLALGDEADIRDHYAQEVAAMREKLDRQETNFQNLEKHLRGLLAASDKRHEECERARDENRREIADLHSEIDGLKRQIIRYSAEGVLMLTTAPSPEAKAAAKRVIKEIDGQEGK